MKRSIILSAIFAIILFSCKKDEDAIEDVVTSGPTPYNLVIPPNMPPMNIPANNPMTVEGVALGKKLFYDPILSGDNTQSCASCHSANFSFASILQFSIGIDGMPTRRNSMPIVNLGWQPGFLWDGGAADLESQVIGPITNPVEMHETLENVLVELKEHSEYPALFKAAFGEDEITIPKLMKAVAQFERTMISANSKYDRYAAGQESLTPLEIQGLEVFTDMTKGDCNHCHVLGSTFSDFAYRNTGLDSIPFDDGRYAITLLESDRGKFKTPSLRNVELTAPYMHDGRFSTLLECVEHYNTGFRYATNLDPNIAGLPKGRMSQQEMEAVVAFLLTLTDTEFVNNPAFRP
jgi:cytochrome c peroxidase